MTSALAAEFDGFARRRRSALEILQRYVAGRQQAPVDAAEIRHHPVVRLRGGVAELDIVALVEAEIAEAERREHELAGEAQEVERARPVLRQEGAERLVVLAQQDVLIRAGAERRIGLLGARLVDQIGLQLGAIGGQIVEALQEARLEEGVQAIRHFHQVGIRVVDDPILRVWHRSPPMLAGASIREGAMASRV